MIRMKIRPLSSLVICTWNVLLVVLFSDSWKRLICVIIK